MRKFKIGFASFIAILAALAASSPPALASDQTGNITLVAWADGRFFFKLSGTRTGTIPSCSCCTRWEVKSTTDEGRALISMILTALGTGKFVTVLGSGSCVLDTNDTEGVAYAEAL